jgi:single-strand DNA-binding protein
MNVFTFSGNLGKDCRKATTQGGTAVCGFPVAVKAGYGDKEQTIWVDCSIWGKRAESGLPDYLVKGQKVMVSGELGTREHEGKTYLTCKVAEIDLAGGQSGSKPQQEAQQESGFDGFDDDIPF